MTNLSLLICALLSIQFAVAQNDTIIINTEDTIVETIRINTIYSGIENSTVINI